jgi:hypothetical protein
VRTTKTLQRLTISWEGSVTMSSTFEEETGAQDTPETIVLIEEIQEDVLISIETEVEDVEILICTQ